MNLEISKQITKIDLQNIAEQTINQVLDGYESAMEVVAKCEAVTKIAENIKKSVMPNAVNEFQQRKEGDKKTLLVGNFEIEQVETGTRYDYSQDIIWQKINAKIEEVQKLFIEPLIQERKEREEILKATAKNYNTMSNTKTFDVDTETGETFERIPPQKTSNEIVKVKIR